MEANLTSSFLCFSILPEWHQSRHIMLARGRISPVSVIDNVQSPGEVRAGKAMLQFPKHMYSLQVLAMALVSKALIYC